MPTLWIMQFSPPACAARTIGAIVGVQFDLITLNYEKQEHKSPEFLKINPIGVVPLLKDGDFYLSDSHAILKYLLDKYGSAEQRESLYPNDLQTRALVDQALFFDTGVFFGRFKDVYLTIRAAQESKKPGAAGPTPIQKADIENSYAVIEIYLGDKQYIACDHLTLADISLGITAAALQTMHKLDKAKFPRAAAWLDRLNQIPVFESHTRPVFERLAKSFAS